jgi:hypothetical protein
VDRDCLHSHEKEEEFGAIGYNYGETQVKMMKVVMPDH